MKRGPKPQLLIERFMRHVVAPDDPDDCIPWRGFVSDDGYGHCAETTAHRLAYRLFVGDPGDGRLVTIDHLCRNRSCVNVLHLEKVTQRENVRRGLLGQKTHCKHGHPLIPGNLRKEKDGRRRCLTCRRERNNQARVPAETRYP